MVADVAGTNAENRRPYSQAEDPRILAIFNTPIAFYGKVVDEAGQVVSGAKVTFSVNDKFWQERGTHFESSSDENGLFSLTNVRGAAVYVKVVRDDYHTLTQPSTFMFYRLNSPTNRSFGDRVKSQGGWVLIPYFAWKDS